MAHTLVPLTYFNAGEWSPSLDSRIDLPKYRSACRQLRNLIPMKQGGVTRRPGTQFIAQGQSASVNNLSRLEKFQYAPNSAFILEFCHHGIRFYTNGAQVQAAGAPAWVNGTSYPNGAFVAVTGVTYYLYNGPLTPSTVSPTTDTTHWRQQNSYEVPSPYSAQNFTVPNYWDADVFVLQAKQVNNVVYIVHPDFPVWRLSRITNVFWTMQEVQFLTPAMLDQNVYDSTLACSATTGTGRTLTATAPAWVTATYYTPGNSVLQSSIIYNCILAHTSGTFATDLANGKWAAVTIFQAQHVGSYWQLAYNRPSAYVELSISGNSTSSTLPLIGTWSVQTYGTWSADIAIQASYDNGVTYQTITTITSRADANYNLPGTDISGGIYRLVITNWSSATSATPPRVVLTADNQFVYGLVQITAVASAYSATCSVIVPLFSTAATTFWSEGAWSGVRGYPQAITVFQERVWYAATDFEPQRIWATQTDDIENFAVVDQSQDTYGLAFDLNAPGRGPIQWLNAQTDLFAGLAGAEWIVSSGAPNAPITPTQIIALEHSVNGSVENIGSLVIGNACFYVQRKGSSFQQMMFSVFTNKYMSQDMQVLAQHLTAAGVKQFDFQQQFQNQSILWAVCGDGSLISLTYQMDQEVFGWAKHTTGDTQNDFPDFGFISCQVIYGAPGQDDEVWVVVIRGGECNIERIAPVDWQVNNVGQPQLNQAVFADCARSYTSPSTNVFTGFPSFMQNRTVCASIVPLDNSGMIAVRNLSVSGSTVTIPNYQPVTGDVVKIGFPIGWVLQPMRLDADLRAGPIPAIRKAISKIYVRTLNSIGGNWTDASGTEYPLPAYPITQNSGDPPTFPQNVPVEWEVDVGGVMQYADDPVFAIQGSDPLPMTILGLTLKMDIGGKP